MLPGYPETPPKREKAYRGDAVVCSCEWHSEHHCKQDAGGPSQFGRRCHLGGTGLADQVASEAGVALGSRRRVLQRMEEHTRTVPGCR